MTGRDIRNSILQLAIEGQLLPKNPKDEPASVLLARIREEKKRLVEEKKIKKDKPLAPIKDEEKPFDIPESWEWVRLGEIVYNNGQKIPNNRFSYIDIGSINNSKQELNTEEKILNANEAPSRARKIVKYGDILYSTVRPYLHNMCIIDKDFSEEPIASTGFTVISCTESLFNKYLFNVLRSPAFDEYANHGDNAKGIAYPAISDTKMNLALIPLPPLAEQHRIVEKLEELLPLVEEYEEAQTKLDKLNNELPEKLKNSVLQQAIMGRLDTRNDKDEPAPALLARIREEKKRLVEEKKIKKDKPLAPIKDEEKPFDIPESWEWVRLGEISQEISDGTHKTPKYVENGIPFLSVQNISSGKLNINKIKYISEDEHIKLIKRVKPQKTDILICRIGTLGRAIKVNWDFEFSIFVSLGLIRLIDSSLCNYLVACINSPLGYSWIDKVKVGGGTHTYKINLSDLPNFVIPLPPLAEQHRIVDKLEKIFEKIESMK